VRRLVLVPSVVMRPWCLIAEHNGALVVSYPVADENLAAAGEEAPPWLVKVLKALADDRRLRILHRLAQGEASLDDLAEVLGVAKSTVHHHVAQLRGAGLVRVVAFGSSDTRYALRPAIYPEIGEYLLEYLGNGRPPLVAAQTDQRQSS
jgi:DNA-binding transcriptional ArsR family regulator